MKKMVVCTESVLSFYSYPVPIYRYPVQVVVVKVKQVYIVMLSLKESYHFL